MSKYRFRVERLAGLACVLGFFACVPRAPATASEQPSRSVRAVSLAARWESTCAVDQAGDVYCWGSDCHGATPDGLFNLVCSYPKPVPGLKRITQISMGSWNEADCALDRDGAVFCGNRHAGFSRIAVPVARAVATTGDFACALLADGRVSCWSSLGDLPGKDTLVHSSKTPRVLAGLQDVVSLSARRDRIAVVDRKGLAYEVRGVQGVDQPVPPFDIGPVRALVVSEYHRYFDVKLALLDASVTRKREGGYACAIRDDGTLRCWGGDNAFGQLGRRCHETPCRTSFAEMGDVAIEGAPAGARPRAHLCADPRWAGVLLGQQRQRAARTEDRTYLFGGPRARRIECALHTNCRGQQPHLRAHPRRRGAVLGCQRGWTARPSQS